MVIAIFLIFPKLIKPERVFFGAKKTCLWDCLNFRLQKIEMIECSRNWIKKNLIQFNYFNILVLFTEIKTKNGDEVAQNVNDDDREIFIYLEAL